MKDNLLKDIVHRFLQKIVGVFPDKNSTREGLVLTNREYIEELNKQFNSITEDFKVDSVINGWLEINGIRFRVKEDNEIGNIQLYLKIEDV